MQYLGKHKLKPYNITNYGEKNSIALAYMDEKKKMEEDFSISHLSHVFL